VRREQDDVGGDSGRVQILLRGHLVIGKHARADDERRRPVELRRGLRAGGQLQSHERLGPDDAKPPRVGEVVVGRPAGEVEQLIEGLALDRLRAIRLVGAARADRGLDVHLSERYCAR
jgi:hypothetical protein